MTYQTNIHYRGNTVTIKSRSKIFNGNWELNEFLKFLREKSGITFQAIHMISDINKKEMLRIENNEQLITAENLYALQKAFKFPKKIINLGVNPNKPYWANKLYNLRNNEKLTLAEISSKLEVALTTYAGYEKGDHEPDINTLIKIADYYNITLDELTGRTENKV